MKKTIVFIILVLISIKVDLKAQTNSKFFADTCYWYVYDWNYTGNPMISPPSYRHEYQKVEGDTVYNGKVHQKVFRKIFSSAQNINPSNFNFYGYYLNDSGKVFLGTTLGSLTLTYDFNLAVGDSFLFNGYTGGSNTPTNFYTKVNTVDSIFLGNKWRKRISFFNTNYFGSPPQQNVVIKWVDGIGDQAYGPIHSLGSIQTLKGLGDIDLMCFTENFNQVIGSCSFIGLNNSKVLDEDFLFYPQPTSGVVYLQSTQLISKQENIPIVYDISGKQLFLPVQYINTSTYKLDVSSLSAGMYIVAIKTENSVVRKKMIVEK